MVLSKEQGQQAINDILLQKIDGEQKNNKKTVDRLMKKFFDESWNYQDAAGEGFIETSRAHSLIHKVINEIKLDDEEESLVWKSK